MSQVGALRSPPGCSFFCRRRDLGLRTRSRLRVGDAFNGVESVEHSLYLLVVCHARAFLNTAGLSPEAVW
ncbi:hypothetical protein [Streptomyces sp. NPDC047000]|uniref:hypothetical protein n=1 Tax=Streptomyces sp. NPDC047000 TaxID=3155474 RepID=UPI0033D4F1A2